MRVMWCRRPSARRVAVGTGGLLGLLWATLLLQQTFRPDLLLLPPSPHLSAVPLRDFFWLDWVAGDYFRPRESLLSPLPSLQVVPKQGCQDGTFLVVLVTSPANAFSTRKLIRHTWGYAVRNRRWPRADVPVAVEVYFVLGQSSDPTSSSSLDAGVRAEARTFGDLIVGDFADTYRNLSLKTLTGLKWVREKCAHTEFTMKVDQDTLVDFPRLTTFLETGRHSLHHAVIGKLYFNSKRRDSGKWRVGPEEYPLSVYPTFAGGPCYLLSTDIVGPLVNVSQYLPLLALEDVHVTGVLARALGVRRLHMRQLQNWASDSLCALVEEGAGAEGYQVSMTNLSPDQLRQAWSILVGNNCSSSTLNSHPPD
ncbi:beta-1,3-galactosyltransferase 5-like [Babylonia areolata]|uniref:beta-1,3-galactosyltransferase 5-like n=1 Tax=Babylonia areolata TaxID=304850 RepID=UPI003FCFB12D